MSNRNLLANGALAMAIAFGALAFISKHEGADGPAVNHVGPGPIKEWVHESRAREQDGHSTEGQYDDYDARIK